MKFRFRLERVLDFVKLKETTKKMEVAYVAGELIGHQRRKESLELSMRRLLEDTRIKLQEGAQWIPYQVSQIDQDRREIHRVEDRIIKAKELLEEKKHELARLSMRRKALENLREKRSKEFRLEEVRREQKRADELYRIFNPKGDEN